MSTVRRVSARLAVSRARAAFLLLLLSAGGCSPAYVLRAGWEEARILSARRPIRAVIHDTTVARETRDKLRLVLDARDFAERDLGLRAGASYESFSQLHRDTLVLNVLAAPEFALRWKTWWFPIVGHVPYKGYFDFDDARAEAASLAEEGYDVSLRPVAAFSTLGWFPDPIMSTTLRLDSLGLVETVIHEILHSTYFPTGQADFNESFANFVGHRGAIEFFCEALADESTCVRAQRRWEDARTFGHFFHSILAPLEKVYASTLPDDSKRRAKREVFEAAARRFETEYKPRLHARYGSIDPDGLDNAWMISRLLYYTRLDDFERVYESHGSLVPSLEALMREAAGGDPWEALTRLVGPADTGPGQRDSSGTAEGSR